MSKYVLVYLTRGEVEKYHNQLVSEVGPKFGENFMIGNPRPSHVTLKSPFYMENTSKIEAVLEKFVKKQKSSEIKIVDFGNFHERVAFLKTDFSAAGKEMQKELLSELKDFPELEFGEFDLKWHPHLTIAYGNVPETFEKIWEYLQTLSKPKFDLKFDNISLLKKVQNRWEVYKIFEIK
jgi:2'-5' RNA ligase